MGLPLETRELEIVLKVAYKVKPGLHPFRFFQKHVAYRCIVDDKSYGDVKSVHFEGINYGWLQLTPTIKKPKPVVKKKRPSRKKR